jgi:septal ring factor EnvC (AmiA/AmiB activator)
MNNNYDARKINSTNFSKQFDENEKKIENIQQNTLKLQKNILEQSKQINKINKQVSRLISNNNINLINQNIINEKTNSKIKELENGIIYLKNAKLLANDDNFIFENKSLCEKFECCNSEKHEAKDHEKWYLQFLHNFNY